MPSLDGFKRTPKRESFLVGGIVRYTSSFPGWQIERPQELDMNPRNDALRWGCPTKLMPRACLTICIVVPQFCQPPSPYFTWALPWKPPLAPFQRLLFHIDFSGVLPLVLEGKIMSVVGHFVTLFFCRVGCFLLLVG